MPSQPVAPCFISMVRAETAKGLLAQIITLFSSHWLRINEYIYFIARRRTSSSFQATTASPPESDTSSNIILVLMMGEVKCPALVLNESVVLSFTKQ